MSVGRDGQKDFDEGTSIARETNWIMEMTRWNR